MGKIRDFFYLLVIAVLISLSIIFIGAAFREEYPLWKNQKILEDLRSDVKAEETGDGDPGIDWEKLKKINPDIVGWIKVPGTRIDYPVLQGSRWNEYLHKNYKGESSYAGSIFIQPEASFEDKHLILYGHNMRTRSMFGSLHEFESGDFYKKNNKIYLYQPEKVMKYTVYSVYDCLDKSTTYLTDFTGDKKDNRWLDWLSMTIEKNAYYPIKKKPKKDGQILTLSTCSGKKKGDDYRLVVNAVIKSSFIRKIKGDTFNIKKKYPIFMPACGDGVFPGIIVRCFKSTGGICTAKIPNHCCA